MLWNSFIFFIMAGLGGQCSHQGPKNFTQLLINYSGVEGYCLYVHTAPIFPFFLLVFHVNLKIYCYKVQKLKVFC